MRLPAQQVDSMEDVEMNFEAIQELGISSGRGVPSFTPATPEFYFRRDTPGTASQRLYVFVPGSGWTGIL